MSMESSLSKRKIHCLLEKWLLNFITLCCLSRMVVSTKLYYRDKEAGNEKSITSGRTAKRLLPKKKVPYVYARDWHMLGMS